MPARRRFTQYDALEEHGVFASNPANINSTDNQGINIYKGPVEYPKMLYHPTGETRQTVAPELVVTPLGAKEVGEQRELISVIVNDEVDAQEYLEAGWHEHPADALTAGGHKSPPRGPADEVKILKEQIRKLEEEKTQRAQASVAPKPQEFASALPLAKGNKNVSMPEPRSVG